MPLGTIRRGFRRWRQWRTYLIVVVLAYLLVLAVGVLVAPFRSNLEDLVFDQYQRWKPRPYDFDQPVRIVDIDDESIHLIGRWPWSRHTMAELVDTLAKAKVAAIGFDVLFSEKDRPSDQLKACAGAVHRADAAERCAEWADGDIAFAHAIQDRPVVLGVLLTETHNGSQASLTPKAGFSFVGDNPSQYLTHFVGALPPIPELADATSGLGFLNWLPDDDRVVRRVPLIIDLNGQIQPSLAMEALRVAQGASGYVVKSTTAYGKTSGKTEGVEAIKDGQIVIPVQADGELRVWFAKSDPRRSIPAWKVLQPDADLSDLEGKVVFVGASASLLGDIVATPLDPSTPGVEAHAQLIEQILSGVTLQRPDWARGLELIVGGALALILAGLLPFVPIYWTALLGFLATAAICGVSWYAFTRNGILLDPVTPSLSAGFVFLAGVGQLYGEKRQQVQEIRSAFGRFVSPAVVARLAEHPENLQLGGQQRALTLMFCDIRSFTTLSESFTAVELSTFLNEYLSPMTNVILKELGTVDKYMGDAIMAFWNAPLDDPEHGLHAVRSALEMRVTLVKLNAEWKKRTQKNGRPFPEVRFGIGLNTGECSVGNMGSNLRFDYSALGDEVNIASRLEGSSKQFGVDIVASESTRDEAPDFAWLEIDHVKLKNKTRAVGVYALAGDDAYAGSEEFRRLSALHDEILSAYRARKFAEANRLAGEAARIAPEEVMGLYRYYQRRFADLAEHELGEAWVPMIALDEK
ncbi:MAG TPA: adenylate/guanylate cyclase domain-containing protein [Roseiarcus sp.]|nr:adenylate/guanylate cyclase domain-containing protein [Roseiarcus sp.]